MRILEKSILSNPESSGLILKTLLFGLLWVNFSSSTSAENLCNPILKLQNTTVNSIAITWRCNSSLTVSLKGYELYYKAMYRNLLKSRTLEFEKHEITLTDLELDDKYQLFIEAIHHNRDVTDRSEVVEIDLPSPTLCKALVEIKQVTLTSITLKWGCTNNNPYPFQGYTLKYGRKMDGNWRHATMDRAQQEFTLTELKCGATYEFYIHVDRHPFSFYDRSDTIQATLGGLINYPLSNDFLEVHENSVVLKLDLLKPNCFVKKYDIELKELPLKLIKDINPDSSRKRLEFPDLKANTEYELYVSVDEDVKEAGTSYTFRTLCSQPHAEKALVAPSQEQLLRLHPKYFVVRLEKWECVDSFAIEYRMSGSAQWKLVSNNTKAEQKSIVIQQLSLRYTYDVRITANNQYGSTVAEYEALQYLDPDKEACGDWIPFRKKCVKLIKDAGLLSKNEAREVCNKFKEPDAIPSLLAIKSHSEERRVKESLGLTGPVWLGMHSDDGEAFMWDDGSQVGFSAWYNQSVHEKTSQCVQMLESTVRARFESWRVVSCSARNYVVCEKPIPKSSGVLIEELRATVAQLQTTVAQLEMRLLEAEKENQSIRK